MKQGADILIRKALLAAEIKYLQDSRKRHYRIINLLQVRMMEKQDKLNKLEKMEGEK